MGHNSTKPPALAKFKRWMCISFVITISLFLLWIFREASPSEFKVHEDLTLNTRLRQRDDFTKGPHIPSVTPTPVTTGTHELTLPHRSETASSSPYYRATAVLPTPEHLTLSQSKKVQWGQEPPFMLVNKTKTRLISAYLEHRTGKKEVRVIAVVLRKEAVSYRCLFCCQEKLHISKGVCNINKHHFNFAYGQADIMCPIPSGCETPSHIAVASAAPKTEETSNSSARSGNGGHDELLQPAKPGSSGENDKCNKPLLEVKNQKADNNSFPYNFTVCFSTMFEFSNVLQLVQSLEMLQLLGVNRVVIYKTSCSPETKHILDYYTLKGLVEVIPWPITRYYNVSHSWLPRLSPGDIHYFGQISALNDCVYRYMYQSRYVALHDMDELILPQSLNSWLELLPLVEKKYGADKCYRFENNIFPNTVMRAPPPPQTLSLQERWKNVTGVNIFSHLYQQPILRKTRYSNFKIIVNPRAVFSATVHGLMSSKKGCTWVDRNIARMYHTRAQTETKLTPKQLIYDGRLLNYTRQLVPAIDTVLRDTELLPKDSMH